MLSEITIDNLGVIARATAELSDGLTVLTGETGAGKTMVVTGLRLLAGGRAEASRIRSGADRAVVEGIFDPSGLSTEDAEAVAQAVSEAGGDADENGDYLAVRTVSANGRSRAHLGGRSVPAQVLSSFASTMLTVHGQNDQLRLLEPAQQLAALDRFGDGITAKVQDYRESFDQWRALSKDLKNRTESRLEIAQEVDRLTAALAEIDRVDPTPGEDSELKTLINRLQDVDSLRESAMSALGAIDGTDALAASAGASGEEEVAASSLLGQATGALVGSEDPELRALGQRLEELTSNLGDISAELGSFLSGLPADLDELETSLQRQQELKSLTRKYAPDIDGVLIWRDKARRKLSGMDTSSEALEELKAEVDKANNAMLKAGRTLSKARHAAAEKLGELVTQEIQGLAMGKSIFSVNVTDTTPGPTGMDEVELLLSNTPATPGKPLATAASGGELSRVMLALEVILAEGGSGMTLVFDEVDAGVGGRAAAEIGRRLARLAVRHQVIVVTHLPQVAAYADTHLAVAKEVTDEAAISGVVRLSDKERVVELARMLAGLDDTDTGKAHAEELLHRAQKESQAFRIGS